MRNLDLYVKICDKLEEEGIDVVSFDGCHVNAKYGELYKILSEGIHNLDEKTCDSLFDFLIELILLILEKEQSMKKEEQYLKQLSQTYNTIFNKDNPKE